jgi:hypothetical protein
VLEVRGTGGQAVPQPTSLPPPLPAIGGLKSGHCMCDLHMHMYRYNRAEVISARNRKKSQRFADTGACA